jgi:ABC-type branched-subunit amino acid transport system substrate-binding protein
MTKFIKSILLLVFICSCSTKNENQANAPTKLQKKVEVAILMPMSSTNAEIGKRLSNLIRAGIEDSIRGNVSITIYDSATEEFTNKSMDQIIQRKTQIILGPLLASDVNLIKDRAKSNNIDIITLSNSSSVVDTNVFVFGHTPLKQTERIINYLLSNKNYKNFVLLLPQASHTGNLVKVLGEMIGSQGGKIYFVEKYETSSEESMTQAVEKIQEVVDEINESGENSTKPLIYVADEAKNLSYILNLLHKNKLDRKAIIFGDNRLDLGDNTEVMFTGSLNHINSKISENAEEFTGSKHLNYMDKLAYDLGSLVGYAIDGEFSRERFHLLINNQSGFRNTSGLLRFSNGIAQRRYDIIKKKESRYSIIDKAEDFGEVNNYNNTNIKFKE